MEGSDFDLLQGHEFGDATLTYQNNGDAVRDDVLVWSKAQTSGHHPAAREGHSAVCIQKTVLVFGGHETGTGNIPPPRTHHAACASRTHMFVHGGEGAPPTTASKGGMEAPPEQSLSNGQLHGSVDNTMTSSGTDAPNNLQRPAGPLRGVSMGDNIATKISSLNLNKTIAAVAAEQAKFQSMSPDQSQPQCLDDLYALEAATGVWTRLYCSLAPLPRKGHSLCVASLQGREQLLLFGGYSTENLALSNSVQVCYLDHAHNYCAAVQAKHSRPKPLCWRTLSCRGTPPSPRYRHSCTVVDSDGVNNLLVIVGGIGRNAQVALCDVHILDMASLTWCSLTGGNDALMLGTGGVGPSVGIYGHCAFPVYRGGSLPDGPTVTGVGSSVVAEAKTRAAASVEVELIVFGGSSNTQSVKANCHQRLYSFHLSEHYWRVVNTSHAFPMARNSFSCAVVRNWGPVQEIPSEQERHLRFGASPFVAYSAGCAPPTTAVVFGGMASVGCLADTWLLDLRWRPLGVEQYDSSVRKQAQMALNQQSIRKSASKLELAYLNEGGLLTRPTTQQQPQDESLVDERSSELSREGELAVLLGDYNWELTQTLDALREQWRSPPREVRGRVHEDQEEQQQPFNAESHHRTAILSNHNNKYRLPSSAQGAIATALPTTQAAGNGQQQMHPSKSEPTLKTGIASSYLEAESRQDSAGVTQGRLLPLSTPGSQANVSSLRQRLRSLINSTKQQHELLLLTQRGLYDGGAALGPHSMGTGVSTGIGDGRVDEQLAVKQQVPSPHASGGDGAEVGKAFLRVRKERAQADLQLQRERDRAVLAETRLEQTTKELEQVHAELAATQQQFSGLSEELRRALEQSMQRERQLQVANDEVNRLLVLAGLGAMQARNQNK